MSTNEDAARAMAANGSPADKTLGEFWLRCGLLDRDELDRIFAIDFEKWNHTAHYLALGRSIKHMEVT